MNTLPKEIRHKILLSLNHTDILSYYEANDDVKDDVKDDWYFWSMKAEHDYGYNKDKFLETTSKPIERYMELYTTYGYGLFKGSEKYLSVDECLFRSCIKKDYDLINYFVKLGGELNSAYNALSINGDFLLEKFLSNLSKKEEQTSCIKTTQQQRSNIILNACASGNIMILDRYKDDSYVTQSFNRDCIKVAIKNGHLNVIKYIENNMDYSIENNFIESLFDCIRHGHLHLVKYYIENNNNVPITISSFFKCAFGNGHLNIIKYLIDIGYNTNPKTISIKDVTSSIYDYLCLNYDLSEKFLNNNLAIITCLMDNCLDHINDLIKCIFDAIIISKNIKLLKFFVNKYNYLISKDIIKESLESIDNRNIYKYKSMILENTGRFMDQFAGQYTFINTANTNNIPLTKDIVMKFGPTILNMAVLRYGDIANSVYEMTLSRLGDSFSFDDLLEVGINAYLDIINEDNRDTNNNNNEMIEYLKQLLIDTQKRQALLC